MTRFFWQFKNGTLAEMTPSEVMAAEYDFVAAWDRSLGGFVLYER